MRRGRRLGGADRRGTWIGVSALASAAILSGCGGSNQAKSTGTTTDAAQTGTQQSTVSAVPPVSDLELVTGTPQHQIRATVKAFYRAAWQDDAQRACALFTAKGAAGFIDAAKMSFPSSVNQFSTCKTVMEIYNAAIQDSVSNLQGSDPTVTGDSLNNVTIGDLKIHGNSATATGPLNALPMINPRQLFLLRVNGRWLMNGEQTPKSNITNLLKKGSKPSKK